MAAKENSNRQSTSSSNWLLPTANGKKSPKNRTMTSQQFQPCGKEQMPIRQASPGRTTKPQSTCFQSPFDGASGSHLPPPPPPQSQDETPSASSYQAIGMLPAPKPFTQPSISKEGALPSSGEPLHLLRDNELTSQRNCPWFPQNERAKDSSGIAVEKIRMVPKEGTRSRLRSRFTSKNN